MTQKEKILQHLEKHGSITDLDAYRLYAVRRLGARIWDLRADGFKIRSQNTKGKNRFGQFTHFTTYIFEG
jgi:hypothetical protein